MFLPNIKCPYCNYHNVVAISGYGSKLSTREKECKKCKKNFYIQIFTTTTKNKEVLDGEISNVNQKIKYLNNQKKKLLMERLIQYEISKKLNDEALEIANEMKRKASMN